MHEIHIQFLMILKFRTIGRDKKNQFRSSRVWQQPRPVNSAISFQVGLCRVSYY
jgi:hypothetical protein